MPLSIATPIILLGFGDHSGRKLLVAGGGGVPLLLPVFTDPERAERYRSWQQSLSNSPGRIRPWVIAGVEQAREVLGAVIGAGKVAMVALNPDDDDSPCLCLEFDEFLEALGDTRVDG